MFGLNHLSKVKIFKIKEKKSKEILPKDELVGELVGYKNQFIQRTKYIFEYDKAVACYNEIESDNEIFLEDYSPNDGTRKNVKREGNILSFEWSDEFFEQKGKGSSKEEIKKFLKLMRFKIKDDRKNKI